MNGDQIAQIAYLGLLGAALAGIYLVSHRETLSKTLQQAAVWVLIFLGVIAGVGLWSDIQRNISPHQSVVSDNRIEVPQSADGHYHLILDINGTPVDFVVDTGATEMVLSREDAARIGIDVDNLAYLGTALTANGMVRTAPIRLDRVALGPIVDQNVRAVVNEGELFGSLLGMGYLDRFQRIEIAGDRLILTR